MNEQPISLETNYFGALGYHRQGSLCATPTTCFASDINENYLKQ